MYRTARVSVRGGPTAALRAPPPPLLSFTAVYDGGAIAVDTAVAGDSSAEVLSTTGENSANGTDGESAVELSCVNVTFHGNKAGERGGSLYSTTVRVCRLLRRFFCDGVVSVVRTW